MLEFDFDSPNIEIAEISEDKKYGRIKVLKKIVDTLSKELD